MNDDDDIKLPVIDLAAIDQVLTAIAAKAGRPRHCCEISFGRLDADDEMTIGILVHLGKMPAISRKFPQTAKGCGTTLEEAVEDVMTDIERYGLLSAHETEKRRARRAAKNPSVGEVPEMCRIAYEEMLASGEVEKLRDLRGEELMSFANAKIDAGSAVKSPAVFVELSIYLRLRDGTVKRPSF